MAAGCRGCAIFTLCQQLDADSVQFYTLCQSNASAAFQSQLDLLPTSQQPTRSLHMVSLGNLVLLFGFFEGMESEGPCSYVERFVEYRGYCEINVKKKGCWSV